MCVCACAREQPDLDPDSLDGQQVRAELVLGGDPAQQLLLTLRRRRLHSVQDRMRLESQSGKVQTECREKRTALNWVCNSKLTRGEGRAQLMCKITCPRPFATQLPMAAHDCCVHLSARQDGAT